MSTGKWFRATVASARVPDDRHWLALTLLTYGVAAAAADEPAAPEREEVIVTGAAVKGSSLADESAAGSRLGVSVLEAPAAISSIAGQRIELRGNENMNEAITGAVGYSSGFSSGGAGYTYTVRGFSGFNSMTVLYDGTKSLINSGSMSYPYDTWNVERIEVLSGAASVLYGQGGIGGAVNVVPRKPSATAEHTARAAAGSFDSARTAFDSTGPITDELLYRISVSQSESDGHVDRGDSSGLAASGSLAYEVSEALSLTVLLDYGDRDQATYNGLVPANDVVDESRRKVNYAPYDAEVNFEDLRLTFVTDWQLGTNLKVKNTAYYLKGDRLWHDAYTLTYRADVDKVERSSFGTWLQHQRQLGNQLQALWQHSLFGHSSTTSVGFEVADLQNQRFVDNWSGTDLVDVYDPEPGTFPTGAIRKDDQEVRVSQYALFAENRLEILPDLALVTGLRADYTDIDRSDLDDGTAMHQVYKPISWRAGMVYSLAPQFNLYAQYSTAVDPVASLCCSSASNLGFDLSEGRQAEVGLKSIMLDGRLEWTLALYDIVKENLLTSDPENPSATIQVGQQSSRGIEASLALQATATLRIELNGSILEARYDDYYQAVAGERVSRIGNRPNNVPEELGQLSVVWTPHPMWLVWGAVEYKGDIFSDAANASRVPSHTLTDLGLRWKASNAIAVDLRASNVFDKFHAETTSGSNWVIGEPRALEAAFTMHF